MKAFRKSTSKDFVQKSFLNVQNETKLESEAERRKASLHEAFESLSKSEGEWVK